MCLILNQLTVLQRNQSECQTVTKSHVGSKVCFEKTSGIYVVLHRLVTYINHKRNLR